MQQTTMAERQAFSQRLREALKQRNLSPDSPTQLAREFNLRYQGDPITPHAARKWLSGETLPMQDKLRTLAEWLGLSAQWLRYGNGEGDTPDTNSHVGRGRLTTRDIHLINDILRLDEESRTVIHTLIRLINKLKE